MANIDRNDLTDEQKARVEEFERGMEELVERTKIRLYVDAVMVPVKDGGYIPQGKLLIQDFKENNK